MTLPSSGALSLADIQGEFGGANPISLSEYYAGGGLVPAGTTGTYGAVPSSGAISIQNFYGTSNAFTFYISGDTANADLRTLAINAGWNQNAPLTAVVNSGVYVYATNTSTPALTINGSFPNGIILSNDGFIVGMGGAGGTGAAGPSFGGNGNAGGVALSVSVGVGIYNYNVVGGGGGGGGGGAGGTTGDPCSGYESTGGGGGGGGRSGRTDSSGGAGGDTSNAYSGGAGGNGNVTSAGSGGVPGPNASYGGDGGNWGTSGSGDALNTSVGGAGGACTSGNSNITWYVTGTRLGALN